MEGDGPAPQSRKPLTARSLRKREAILRAAADLFLDKGYLGTSVDDIAAAAAVSKQTVYKHFGDKERLFTEIVIETTHRFGQPFFDEVETSRDAESVEPSLLGLARTLTATVMEPRVLRLRRLVVAEARRFPSLGRQYFEEGPGRGIVALASLFAGYAERGLLRLDDPGRAASHFTWLVVSTPINRVMLCGEGAAPSPDELEQMAREAVGIFLAAFGPAPRAR